MEPTGNTFGQAISRQEPRQVVAESTVDAKVPSPGLARNRQLDAPRARHMSKRTPHRFLDCAMVARSAMPRTSTAIMLPTYIGRWEVSGISVSF